MIEVEHLSKHYGDLKAVRDLSFRVDKGALVGFLGPNGAGKSTTLRILAGYLGPTSGRVTVAGHDVVDERLQALRKIGYMAETSPLYPELKVREYLAFRAECKRVPRGKRRAEIARAVELARVSDMAGVVIGHLSKGYRQRVGLADALLGSPPLLILDEPTAGLDPNQIREVRALIRSLAGEHTVLLSTHILSEVEAVCQSALVIAKGKLVAEGPLDSIRAAAGHGEHEVALCARGQDGNIRELLAAVAGAGPAQTAQKGELCEVAVALAAQSPNEAAAIVERIVAALAAAGIGLREVRMSQSSLEKVFSQLTEEAVSGEKSG